MVLFTIWAVLMFCLTIAFHEFGHFLFAKFFGVKVLRFSIGFGPVLLRKKWRGTEYCFSLIPLGGYVRFSGENGQESETGAEDKSGFFNKKPPWQRILIALAGPLFSFLLAAFLYISSFSFYGYYIFPNKIGAVETGSPAEQAGLKPGDTIVSVNGQSVENWEELAKKINQSDQKELQLSVQKEGRTVNIKVKPEAVEGQNIFKEKVVLRDIGALPSPPVLIKNPAKGAVAGMNETKNNFQLFVLAYWKLFTGKIPLGESLGGPVKISKLAKETYDKIGLHGLLLFFAFINLNLSIFNLLPIPMLDGGHIPFLMIEWIRGKPIGKIAENVIMAIGFFLMLLLVFYVTLNDLSLFKN